MSRPPCRKLTLADLMILVGASAAGVALARPVLAAQHHPWWFSYPAGFGSPVLVSVTVALLLLRLRGPRPASRRLYRQPGAAGLLAASLSVAVWAVHVAIEVARGRSDQYLTAIAYVAVAGGPAVLGAWATLFGAGVGRRERGWLDSSGIVVGAGWLAMMLLDLWEIFLF